ncbi:MAG TPA: hypothetical protein DD727_07815 [Clostridiales bacterium]|nr:hypothetical protein [Clostridiales bacterium]
MSGRSTMVMMRFGNRLIARLDPGDEVITCLRDLCMRQKITIARVTAVGTFTQFGTGRARMLGNRRLSSHMSILPGTASFSGYITTRPDGIHINLFLYIQGQGRQDMLARLDSCPVRGVCELVVDIVDGIVSEDFLKSRCLG